MMSDPCGNTLSDHVSVTTWAAWSVLLQVGVTKRALRGKVRPMGTAEEMGVYQKLMRYPYPTRTYST